MSSRSANTSSTALKALSVLEAVALASRSVSVSEVAEEVGTDRSTAYRMLKTLADAGYVAQDEISKRYRLSYKVVSLSRNLLADSEVTQLIRSRLEQITAPDSCIRIGTRLVVFSTRRSNGSARQRRSISTGELPIS